MFSLLNFKSFIIITVLLTILGTSVYIKFLNSKIDSLETQNTELSEKIKQTENSEKLTLMYAGSLYSGKRDPSILFDAISEVNKVNTEFRQIKNNAQGTNP